MGNAKSSPLDKMTPMSERDRLEKASSSDRLHNKKVEKYTTRSARSSMSGQGNKKPMLSVSQRAIIKYCLENAKEDIGDRIMRRACEKKEDFRGFTDNLTKEQKQEMTDHLKDFLSSVCTNLQDSELCQKLSTDYGARHVVLRAQGFKPDFFAITADAVTTECTFLDCAAHLPSETAGAWSELSSFVFSAVRDGYYAELRKQRKNSTTGFRSRPSMDLLSSSTDGSKEEENNRRSASPSNEIFDGHGEADQTKESTSNFLLPPTVY